MLVLKDLWTAGLLLLLIATPVMGVGNPLLEKSQLPNFKEISPAHFAPAIDSVLQAYNEKLGQITSLPSSWSNTIQALEEETNNVTRVWNVINHLKTVNGTNDVINAYNALLPKISAFYANLMHNLELYQAYSSIKSSPEYTQFTDDKKVVIDQMLLNYKLNGAELSNDKKERYKQINMRLHELTALYANNLEAARSSWQYHIAPEKKEILIGIPEFTLEIAAKKAESMNKNGWIFTLEEQCLTNVLSYAKNRDLRKNIFMALNILASNEDADPSGKIFDNGPIIAELLKLRQELANLLGFNNYVEFSLAANQLSNSNTIQMFLNELANKSNKIANAELQAMLEYAKDNDKSSQISQLEAWDIQYYAELIKQEHYPISQEQTRSYFAETRVLQGLFNTLNILYGIEITEIKNTNLWHPLVKSFVVRDRNKNIRGYFYTDLYTRAFKSPGSWISDYVSRLKFKNGNLQVPVVFIETNFSNAQPGMLSHNDVIVLFHQFGSMLQHVLSSIDYPNITGTNAVAQDAKELAGMFMETWAWQKELIDDISKNVGSGEPLPDKMFDNLIAQRNFNSGLNILKQAELALFDFRLHLYQKSDITKTPEEILNNIRQKWTAFSNYTVDHLANRFAEIFSGNLAAKYYSSKWTEALASDAFSAFKEAGIYNPQIGAKFLKTILERGGEKSILDLFLEFRGREPSPDALLKTYGIN